jgi:hypothetical protein
MGSRLKEDDAGGSYNPPGDWCRLRGLNPRPIRLDQTQLAEILE